VRQLTDVENAFTRASTTHADAVLAQFPADKDKDESFVLELHIFPETKFYLFEQKKDDKPET
jgi:hypothetical protein